MAAFFIYSTGRCATQALARYFAANLGDRAVVEHEPLRARWTPRIALRHPDLPSLRRKLPEVDRHLDRIARTLADGRDYVETGWPAFAWFPYLKSFLGEDFRWAHLVRNPFYVAGSMATHDYYNVNRVDPEFAGLAHLVPTDHGVSCNDLALEWHRLSQFEKCLYLWLEINRFARELSQSASLAPILVARYEDLFGPPPEPLRDFCQAAGLGTPRIDRPERVDRFQRGAVERPTLSCARVRHDVEVLARELRYDGQELNVEVMMKAVRRRYSRPWRGATRTGVRTTLTFATRSLLHFMGH